MPVLLVNEQPGGQAVDAGLVFVLPVAADAVLTLVDRPFRQQRALLEEFVSRDGEAARALSGLNRRNDDLPHSEVRREQAGVALPIRIPRLHGSAGAVSAHD